MNAPAKFEQRTEPFNSFAAYHREREYARGLEETLRKALMLLRMETERRERAGEDVVHLRAFLSSAVK